MELTAEMLRQIARARSANDNMRSVVKAVNLYGYRFGLDVPHRLCQFIPQTAHETGRFKYDEEIWGPTEAQKRYDTRTDLGNTPEKDGDGKKHKGYGAFQVTGRANQRAFRDWCRSEGMNSPDFEAEPHLIATDPWEGLSAIWFWETRNLNKYADQGDIEMVTRKINGGLNGFADRLELYTMTGLVLHGLPVTAKAFPESIKAFQAKAKEQGLYKGEVDGIDGPKTRSAIHMSLVALSSIAQRKKASPAPRGRGKRETRSGSP